MCDSKSRVLITPRVSIPSVLYNYFNYFPLVLVELRTYTFGQHAKYLQLNLYFLFVGRRESVDV